MPQAPRFAILGSCVTRDAFAFADPSWVLSKYMARTALASFCGRKTAAELPPYTNIASAFQRRMVIEDVEKRGRRWVAKQDFDWLIYDPIDERLTIADFEDGGVATVSVEFGRLGLPSAQYRATPFPGQEHFERWTAGWQTFIRLLDINGVRDRLIVHRAKWVERVQGSEEPTAEPEVIARANDWLERAYARMGEDIPPERFISVSEEHQLSDPGHQWGASPFHYVEGYYLEFLEELTAATTALATQR